MQNGETFRPTRKPETDPKNPGQNPPQVQASTNMPPIVAKALHKNLEKMAGEGRVEQENNNYAPPVPQQAQSYQQPAFAQQPVFSEAPSQYAVRDGNTKAEIVGGPRIAFGTNEQLNALIAGMKDLDLYAFREVQLPSFGKFYDGTECPTNGVLHVRAMAGTEEEILSTPALFRNGQAINKIFRACVQEPINPEKMLTVDRTALLVYIRAISYGSDYEVEVRCPACSNKFPNVINLNRDLDACPDDLDPSKLRETLPTTGYVFSYRLPTGADDVLVGKYSEKRSKNQSANSTSTDDTFQYKASLLISAIEDPKSGVKITDQNSIRTLIQRLPINDITYIRNTINEPLFGMDTKCEIDCPVCQERFDIEMPVELNFFFPNIRKKLTRQSTQL